LVHRFWPLIGGIESHARFLAALMAKLGLQSVVLTPRRNPSWLATESVDGFRIERFRSSTQRGLQGVVESWAAIRSLRREKPVLVHCHGLAWMTISALWFMGWNGQANVVKLPSRAHLPKLASWRGRAALSALKRASLVLPVSRWLAAELIKMGLSPERIQVLPNPIDTTMFCPAAAAERENLRRSLGLDSCPTVLYLGRLSPEKGTDTLCATWRHLAPRLGDVQLVVVGDGPDRPLVEKLTADTGEKRVRFVGFRAQVKPYIQAADVMLLPSRTEGMPNAVVEAAACGVPTVATSTQGAQEVIVNGQTGVLVAEEDAQALAAEVETLLRDKDARMRMGRQARELAVRTWGIESTFSILAGAYAQATGGKLRLANP